MDDEAELQTLDGTWFVSKCGTEERVNEQSRVLMCAVCGALVGAAAGYLFFTERGREFRDQLEPLADDLRREFERFQRTFQKVGDMASEGMRVVNEFQAARAQAPYSGSGGDTSH